MTTTEETQPAPPVSDGGPSKKDLKKLAKKAEKAAKKQGDNANDNTEAGAPAPEVKATPAAATAPAEEVVTALPIAERPPPSLQLLHADHSVHTLKALWASQLYHVTLTTVKASQLSPAAAGALNLTAGKPALVYDDQVVLGGGNGMAKAISMMPDAADAPRVGVQESFQIDEWCEWERTHLRHALSDPKALLAALQHLEKALQHSSTGMHLVGHSDTVADVCVVTTLSSMTTTTVDVPQAVVRYLHGHEAALNQAKQALVDLQKPPYDIDNPSLIQVVIGVFRHVIQETFDLDESKVPALGAKNVVIKCQNPKHGDFQCTAAMPMFAALKQRWESPMAAAQALVDALGANHPVVSELSVIKPGFILCRITPSFLQYHINKLMETGVLPKPPVQPQVCLVDFSSPNIAKDMHVGHLRSTIIGESVCRILEYVGHTVHRINHVGDWGTQFGMLIQYLKEEYPNFTDTMPDIQDLTGFYKQAKQRFDENAEFKKASQINVVHLQAGDEDCLKIWRILCDVSRKEFQKVYSRLDINVKECGESFYNEKIPPVIEEFNKAGLVSIEEGGAKCVFVDGYQVPLMLQKSDGGYGYDSTDMAALKYRLFTLKAQRIIVITDFSQGDHFKMCFSAANKIGWLNGQKLEHIGFGTVQGEDGKRFKTRSGDTVRLVDLLDEAMNRMDASLRERISESKANITLDEVHEVAEAIGYGAVKYFDLRRNPTTNYKFSYDQMLDTKGNTAVYLLYAHARLESICTKAKADFQIDVDELIAKKTQVVISHPSERNLALNLHMFADTLEQTLDDLYPYHICDYVYNVSIAASDFVTQCKVLGSPEMESRLLLCRATAMAMRTCFDLLGIRHVMRI